MEVINTPGSQICHRCGYTNPEKAFFCSNCGATIGSKAGRNTDYRPHYQDSFQRPEAESLPLISLLVTIFGFFVAGFIGPLIGVILGHVSLSRMKRSGVEHNRGLAVTSLVIGYLMLALGLVLLIALGVFVGWALFNSGSIDWNWKHTI